MGYIVCFGNQKGGVGKSTLTNLLANFIEQKTDYSVIVVDGDWLQESLSGLRNYELRLFKEEMKVGAKANGIEVTSDMEAKWEALFLDKCYRLVTKDHNSIIRSIYEYRDEYDFVLVDLPGNLQADGVIGVYYGVDFLFVPTDITFKDLDSTRRFMTLYNNRVQPHRKGIGLPCNVFGIFNKVKENTVEFKEREERIQELNLDIPFLKNYITETQRLKRDDSTIQLSNLDGLKNTNMIEDVCLEIIALIEKESQKA